MMPEKEGEKDARTVFVRNLSFDVDQGRLEEVFADIGPVRQCFLVTEKGLTRHKGIAFVQFAIPEDADRAVQELNGKDLAGRKLKIEHAHKRAPLQERKQKKRAATDHDAAAAAAADAAEAPTAKALASALHAAAGNETTQPPAKKQKQQPKQQRQQDGTAAAAAEKHKWVRTVALGGLNREFLQHALELAEAAGGLVETLDPPPAEVAGRAHLEQDGCSGEVVFLVYDTVKSATNAVMQLHGRSITPADIAAAAAAAKVAAAAAAAAGSKGKKGSKSVKIDKKAAKQLKQQQAEAAAQAAAQAAAAAAGTAGGCVLLWARHVAGEGALVKKWRLILRNLAFQATEADVRKLLAPSGAWPWQVTLPTGADGRTRGFAFASFLSYHEAHKALTAANGQLVRKRPVAVDWAIGKEQYQQLKQGQASAGDALAAEAAAARGDAHDDDQDGIYSGSGSEEDQEGFSASGDDEQGLSSDGDDEGLEHLGDSEEGSDDDEEEGSEEDAEQGSGSEDDGEGVSSEGDEALSAEGEEGSGSDGEDFEHDREVVASALDAILGQQQQQQRKQQTAPAKDEQTQDKQQQGKAAAAAAAAGGGGAPRQDAVSRTVFVRGLTMDMTSQDLQARFDRFGAVKACRVVMDKATGKPKGTAFIEFKAAEGAAAAAAACARGREGKGPGVLVKGVKLNVDLALSQDDARHLGQEGRAQGSTGAGGKFDRRNMYLAKEGFIEEGSAQWEVMSENDRRKRKRAAEEKNQKLKSPNFAVSTTRLAIRNIPPSWDEKKLKACFIAGVKERATKENPVVKQVKILRDPERPDPAGHPGGKSRGFGFVEFADHSHALAALRQLNNNPKAFGSAERRPIVEFAVDNVKVLKMREDKLSKQKQVQQQKKADRQAGGTATAAAAEGADAEDAAAAAAPAAGDEQHTATAAAGSPEGGNQQQQLSKRQIKRLKEKQKKLARQERQQQANGVALNKQQKQDQQQQQQGRSKGKKDAAATAAAAAAGKAGRVTAKTQRQQQQHAQEEAVRARKRQADQELDKLAALDGDDRPPAAAAGAGKKSGKKQQQRQADEQQRKRHKPGRAQEEKLDRMVEEYKSKLFGMGNGAGDSSRKAAGKEQQQRDSMKRWFD